MVIGHVCVRSHKVVTIIKVVMYALTHSMIMVAMMMMMPYGFSF